MSDQLSFDVVIVGGGPSGLSAAIRLKQLALEHKKEISVCILEKGSEIGAHTLSGAVLEPRALKELIPDWKERGAPLKTPVKDDRFLFLTSKKSWTLPTPRPMHNKGNYIISLGNFCRWLGKEAEAMGVEIYPGFSVAQCLFNENGDVIGVETQPMGMDKQGGQTSRYEPGVQILARHTLIAEGCRGSVTKDLIKKYNLTKECQTQTYGIGIKELWEIPPENHREGLVVHTTGWPLDPRTYGGSFLYHLENNQVALGFVIGLDYENPYLSPYDEFQRFKMHPAIRPHLEGGKRISYGARALNEGGYQSIPRLNFPGGGLIGCTAGFLNVPKIKGIHTSMKSGMIAAEVFFESVVLDKVLPLNTYDVRLKESWVGKELYAARNIRPGFRWGLFIGFLNAALDTYIFKGRAPWTLRHHRPDHTTLVTKDLAKKIDYPKYDGVFSFDKLSSVFLSNTNHEENQPCHLHLKNPLVPTTHNLPLYDAPETRYCPAGVYEIVEDQGKPRLQINAQNCVHCKTCDIKDPLQNITWRTPEGTGGPNYPNM